MFEKAVPVMFLALVGVLFFAAAMWAIQSSSLLSSNCSDGWCDKDGIVIDYK